MSDWQLKTPVAFLVFNRPDTTERVFDEIRKAKPPVLLVVADGSRPGRPDESRQCEAVRAIIEQVDWKCEVLKNYSDVNLGCKRRVSSGLDWVFENVDQAIILEDDCLPHPTFFRFCEELLEKYRDDERVMHISGTNFQSGRERDIYSYYFSNYGSIWGWASWRRAWNLYDLDMKLYPEIKEKKYLLDICGNRHEMKFREEIFDAVFFNGLNTWDYQWTFARLVNSGLSIVPHMNLISNIGFGGKNSTHISSKTDVRSNMPVFAIDFPLLHPPFMIRDKISDDRFYRKFLKKKPVQIIKRIGKRFLGKL